MTHGGTSIWFIAVSVMFGLVVRPWNLPEWIWAVAGAVALVGLGSLSAGEALGGVARGTDVYLFLVGMMLMAETAREQGLFDWLAAVATRHARGSASRLFLLIYGVGTLVTVFLSNDATAVVLTPAVASVVRAARVKEPLPYLLICAFIANAASFVLPISNPANLVVYGAHLPPLLAWLRCYAMPSVASIVVTYLVLRWTQRHSLSQEVAGHVEVPALSTGGRMAAAGIVLTAAVLLLASARDVALGLPTAITGALTAAAVLASARRSPRSILRNLAWGVLPLVAGLFVVVEALKKAGAIECLQVAFQQAARQSASGAAWGGGVLVALACNLVNNLPAGLIAGNITQAGHLPDKVAGAVLIGIDLGPNLSVTGSLATILWLTALRRDGHHVGALDFLRLGVWVMPPALVLAIASFLLTN